MQKVFWKCFSVKLSPLISLKLALAKRKNLSILRPRKNVTDAGENTFLLKVDKFLKLPLHKTFLEMFCSETVTLISSRLAIAKTSKTEYFEA